VRLSGPKAPDQLLGKSEVNVLIEGANDASGQNPQGSSLADVTDCKKRTLSFMSTAHKIGTWNVRSLYKGKLKVVLREIRRTNVEVLCISEVRWQGMGHFTPGEYKIFFSGHAHIAQSKANSVGFACHNDIASAVLGYNSVNDRIISIRIQGRPRNLTIIQVYAPTSAAETADIDEFYASLQQTVDDAPRQDIVLVMGDLNAIVGKEEATEVSGRLGLGQRNEAGDGLIEFWTSNNIKIINTTFKPPKRRLYTWTSPNGLHENQIDYLIAPKRWISSIQYTKTLPSADCGSDHEWLVAGVEIKLKKIRKAHCPRGMI